MFYIDHFFFFLENGVFLSSLICDWVSIVSTGLFWHSHPVSLFFLKNASHFLIVSKFSVNLLLIIFMYVCTFVYFFFINFSKRTILYILCWFLANFRMQKKNIKKMMKHFCCYSFGH